MKVHPIWDNFSLGEVSSRLWRREGVSNKALSVSKNMIITSQGSAKRRGGFRFVSRDDAKIPMYQSMEQYQRIISLRISDDLVFFPHITQDDINGKDVYFDILINTKYGEYLTEPEKILFNTNFRHGIEDWVVEEGKSIPAAPVPSVRFLQAVGSVTLFSTDDPKIDRILMSQTPHTPVTSTTEWTIVVDTEMPDGDITYGVYIGDESVGDEGDLFNYSGRATLKISTFLSYTAPQIKVVIEGGQQNNSNPRLIVKSINAFPTNSGPEPYRIRSAIPKRLALDMQYLQVPGENTIYMLQSGAPVKYLTYDITDGTFTYGNITFTSPPADWDIDNFPTCGTFFQGRFWLGGCPVNPERFWASKSGNYTDFTVGTAADDAFEFDIAKKGNLRWMLGLKNILFGSGFAELIGTSADGVLTVSDIQMEQQSSNGASTFIQAVEIGNTATFVSGNSSKVRSSFWRWEENAWKSKDITFLAEHLFKDNSIKRIAYQNHPDKILWVLRHDGVLTGATFDDSMEFVGWHTHTSCNGIIDICTDKVDGESVLMALIRTNLTASAWGDNDSRLTVLATMDNDYNLDLSAKADIKMPWLIDHKYSAIDYYGNLVKGVTVNDGTSNNDGTIGSDHGDVYGLPSYPYNPPYFSEYTQVGIDYECEMETLPMDFATQAGSTPSWKKRWNQIYLRMVTSSHYPMINGERPTENEYQLNGLDIEDVKVTNLGHDLHAVINIKQDLPYDLEVLGIYGEMSQSRL